MSDIAPDPQGRPPGRSSRWSSLQTRLAVMICVLVLGTAVVLTGWGYGDFSRASLAQQLREMEVLSSSAEALITQAALTAGRQLDALSREADFRLAVREAAREHSSAAVAEAVAELRDLIEAVPAFVNLQLYDVSGLPVAGLVREGGRVMRRVRSYAFTAEPEALELARRSPVGRARLVGPIVAEAATGEDALYLHVAVPVMDSRGVRVGVLFAEYALDALLRGIRADIAARPGAVEPSLVVVDLYDRGWGAAPGQELAQQADAIRARLLRKPGRAEGYWLGLSSGRQGLAATAFTYMSPDPGRFSVVALAVPESTLLAQVHASLRGRVAAIVVFTLTALIISLAFARSLVRPLEQLLDATRRFGAGEPVDALPTKRRDEVGRLSVAFGQMMRRVRERSEALEQEIRRREQTEDALRGQAARLEASESRYRRLYESVAAGVFVSSPEGRIRSANPAFARMLGFDSEAELEGKVQLCDLWDGPGDCKEHLRRVRREGELAGVEIRLRRRDGQVLWVLQSIRAVWNESGEATAFECTLLDITERRQAERAQRASELRFRRLSDSSLIGVAFGSLSGVMLTEANPYTLRLLRYRADELPLPLDSLITDDWRDIIGRLRSTGRLRQPLEPFEKTLRRRDGSTVPVLVNLTLVDPDRDEFVAAVIDRTAEVESLRRVRELQQFLRFVLDSIPTRVAYVDVDLQVRFFNRPYLEWYGLEAGQVEGRLLSEVIGEDRFAAALPEMRRALAGESRRYEASVQREGRTFHVDISYVPHHDPQGRVLGFFSVVHDVTEARELEARLRQSQKLESLGQLTGGIAHDFNNLLSVIIGNLQLHERQDRGSERERRPVASALRAAMRGADLTRRLLSFSRRQPLQLQLLDLREQVGALRQMIGSTLGAPISVDTDLQECLWSVEVDAGQLENALLNLVINARDAMPEGGRLIIRARNVFLAPEDLRPEEKAEPGEFVSLTVKDDGCGMPPEIRERAFEPFFTTKPTGKGSGLGLAMVYGFVRQSGGIVRLDSRPGRGTVVELLFPRACRQVDGPGQQPAGEAPGGSETILVVEDDADLREMACAALAARGYRTLEATDAQAALALLEFHAEVDLLFADVVLPGGLSGAQLAREARRQRRRLPVLLTTGVADAGVRPPGVADPSAVLWKPYTAEALARRVREVLDTRVARAVGD